MDLQNDLRVGIDGRGAQKGAKDVNRSLDSIGRKSSSLNRALSYLGAGFVANYLRLHADTWTEVNNKLKIYTGTVQQHTAVIGDLFGVAQRTWTEFSALGNLYNKLAISQKALGASAQELTKFVEGVGQSLQLSGSNTRTSAGALLQLGQAMSTSQVYAEEFNSIIEGAPRLALAMAQGIDKAGGSIGALKDLIKSGDVKSLELFRALQSQLPKLEAEFKTLTPTIGSAFRTISNAVTKYVGIAATATGISAGLAYSIIGVADNFDTLANSIIVAGAALGTFYVLAGGGVSVFKKLTAAVWAFNVALYANPYVAVVAALAAVVTWVVLFGDSIQPVTGGLANLHDYSVVAFQTILEGLKFVGSYIGDKLVMLFNLLGWNVGSVGELFNTTFNNIKTYIASWYNFVKGIVNGFIGLFVFAYNAIKKGWDLFPLAMANIIEQAMLWAIDKVEAGVKKIAQAINYILPKDWEIDINSIKIPRPETLYDGSFKSYFDIIQEEAQNAFSVDYVQTWVDASVTAIASVSRAWYDSSEAYRRNLNIIADETRRQQSQLALPTPFIPPPPKPGPEPKFTFDSYIADLEGDIKLSKLGNRERAITLKQNKAINDFAKEKIILNDEQFKLLRERVNEVHYNKLAADATEDFKTTQMALNEQVAEYNYLREKGLISEGIYQKALQETYSQHELIAGNVQSLQAKILDNSKSWADELVDTLAAATKAGKLSFQDFANSVLDDLLKMAIRAAVVKPLFDAITGAFNFGSATPQVPVTTYQPQSGYFSAPRASGGPVRGADSYLVGERGPELFTPASNGFITPNSKSSNNGGNSARVDIRVYNNAEGTQARATSREDGNGGIDIDVIVETVEGKINDNIVRGRGIAPTLQSRYSLNPVGGMT